MIKPTEFNYFPKLPIKVKGCLVMIYIQVRISECEVIEKFNKPMEIVCDTKIYDIVRDRLICSQVIIIIKMVTCNIPYQYQRISHLVNLWFK